MKFIGTIGLVLVFGCHFAATAKPSAITSPVQPGECERALDAKWFGRAYQLEAPKWNDDFGLIRAALEAQGWSNVRTFFSKEWDTQVYYTASGAVQSDDFEIPLVDPDSKAVVVFFHGSGTVKSSGANFVQNMSTLSNLGYSAVSIDMPFHASGSLREKQNDAKYFMSYMRKIVEDIKSFGKPVYFVGHSFGPDVMFELITRYPELAEGVLAMSPAGYNKVLSDWYRKHTAKMDFGGQVLENTLGSTWAGNVSNGFLWNKHLLPDPTIVKPKLKMRILTGDREEYVPGPTGGPKKTPTGPNTYNVEPVLRGIFKNADIVVEKGIGHYLFDFRDEQGLLVVQRELMKLLGDPPQSEGELVKKTGLMRNARSNAQKIAHLYKSDFIFKAWIQTKYSEELIRDIFKTDDTKRAHLLMIQYQDEFMNRFKAINQEIAKTKASDPEFYRTNQAAIELALRKNKLDMGLLSQFYIRKYGASISIN